MKPLRANLAGVSLGGGTINLTYFFPSNQAQRSELASDLAFIDRGEAVVVEEAGRHFDLKAIKRNELVKVDADARMVAA